MSQPEFDRVKGDLAIIQRAMALRVSFGREMVVFGVVLGAGAAIASGISLWSDRDVYQLGAFAAISMLCVVWLYHHSRRVESLGHETKLQVGLSIAVYAAVIGAAAGYWMAAAAGPALGAARTAGLYAAAVGYVVIFLVILLLNALKSRERYYCLGLAAALLLVGLLIPIVDRRFAYPIAHGCMAIGALAAAILQSYQLNQAGKLDGAD
ncbi:MAG: hypothetical protein ACREJD_17430 [Phycisphaerales bacterium]